MKKFITLLIITAFVSPLFALRPGDRAADLNKLQILSGNKLSMAPASAEKPTPALRAAVFILCRAINADTTMQMLNELQKKHRKDLSIAVITPDALPDAEFLLQRSGKCEVTFALDRERNLTRNYMAGSLLYPMAFLVNSEGIIIWRGEAVDMAEKIPAAINGKLSVSKEAEIADLTSEMHQLLRDNSETKMRRLCKKIFSLEPGNAAAMRLRLFTLENTNRIQDARKLIAEQLEAAPELTRLYFTAADFFSRYGCSDMELNKLIGDFEKHISNQENKVRMAWLLLERFPYYSTPLEAAAKILRQPLPEESLARANAATARAILEYRLGNTKAALNFQQDAVKQLNHAGTEDALRDAKRREQYFRTVLKLK